MMARFCRYADKVFDLSARVAALRDARPRPWIATAQVWWVVFTLLATGRKSLNAWEADRQLPQRLRRGLGPDPPSPDTLGRVFALMDPGPVREMLAGIGHQLKRNQALPLEGNFRFAAVDGHEFFASRQRHCAGCSQRTLSVNGQEVVEYYHRGVVCHLVGYDLALPLDVELQQPGEGEVPAARRLLQRVFRRYARFFDAIVADGLYLEAPFFNFCRRQGKHVLAVLKGEHRLLLQDARGLFATQPPQLWQEGHRSVQVWDEEGFTSCEGVAEPLRVLHTIETHTRRTQENGRVQHKSATQHWWWATTLPKRLCSSRELWRAGHARWDIENDAFNTLGTHFPLDHCFKHDPVAILNFVLILFIVFVLLQSFLRGNLKPARRAGLTLIALTLQLYAGWVHDGRRLLLAPPPRPPDTS